MMKEAKSIEKYFLKDELSTMLSKVVWIRCPSRMVK